jgi:predicted RNase H-like HicB family nuclease
MNEQKHTAVYTPAGEPGWWTVQIADVPGAISQGHGIEQAREHIREALAAVLDVDATEVELVDDVRLTTPDA